MRFPSHTAWCLCLTLLAASPAWSASAAAADDATEATRTTTEVKRSKVKGPKHASLQFLRDNRVFIRGQLDRLRLLTTVTRDGRATVIDERMLRLQELAAAIAAARDTVAVEAAATARRELLDSVTRLGDIENQLSLMETLTAEQAARLQVLENDFLGRQETAVVVLVRGMPASGGPAGLTLSEDNDVLRVPLHAAEHASLQQGGVAQVYHRFVEPRAHLYTVGFAGAEWAGVPAVEVPVTAARDRITFVELDLSRLTPDPAAPGLAAKVWLR